MQGGDVAIRATGGTVTVGDARVVKADVMASNGVIHVIDKVLMPPR
ncbi:fasciclin domain-containing protein [Hymenobacter sediminis]|nr:fasciclin domain-containing protein [Hymenobacter sediminis]